VEDLARIQTRLNNIHSVLPILGALRTISLGSWQMAQKQKAATQQYEARLLQMIPWLLPLLPSGQQIELNVSPQIGQRVVLAVGSERGLCGRFNATVAGHTEQYLSRQQAAGQQIELWALGGRLYRLFQRRQQTLAWSSAAPTTPPAIARLAFDLTRRWLTRFEAHQLDAVDLIYNTYLGVGRYRPTVVRLLPPSLPAPDDDIDESWPPPIIETDPLRLYTRIIEQWTAIGLYGRLLESSASEHSTRFQLMEAATQNAERLVDELTIEAQAARRQAITQEMQSLAAGAGLLGST